MGISIGRGLRVGAGEAASTLAISTSRFLKGTATDALLASVIAPVGWTVTLLSDFGGRVKLSGRQVQAATVLSAVASGTAKLRAVSVDGREAVERTFDLSVYDEGVSPPAPVNAEPYIGVVAGDSFGQRVHDTAGSPNDVNGNPVNPVNTWWATDLTNRVGGQIWGAGAWLPGVSLGKYDLPFDFNRAIGGSNTNQMASDGGNLRSPNPDRLSIMRDRVQTANAAGRRVDFAFVPMGTNDFVTFNSAPTSLENIRKVVRMYKAQGKKYLTHTALPRGLEATAGQSGNALIDGRTETSAGAGVDRRPFGDAFNAGLKAMVNEAEFVGWLGVADCFAQFQDPNGAAWAVKPGLTYDELHLSAEGNRILVAALVAELDRLFPTAVADRLATPANQPVGLFEGTGGTFAGGLSGQLAANWRISAIGAFHTNPGTKVASIEPGPVGNDQVFTVNVDTTPQSTDASIGFALVRTVPIPADVAIGDYYQVGIELEAADLVQYRGSDLEMIVGEGGVTRTVRCLAQAPADPKFTPFMSLTQFPKQVMWTTPRKRTADTAATVDMRACFYWAGKSPIAAGKVRARRPMIRKANVG